jgi:hypothetical protein
MGLLWSFLSKPKNRQMLSWVGGGLVAVAAGAFAVVTYLWPAQDATKPVCAQQGIALGGNISGSNVTNSVSGSTITAPCAETKK